MARVKVTLLIVALLSLAGCSALFDFNAFKTFDTPPAPKASDYQGSSGLDKLSADLSSAAVVDKLKADPATTLQIETDLDTTYHVTTATPTSVEEQQAAALYADLNLKTTSGEELVNNVVAALVSPPSGSDLKAMIAAIVPADVQGNQTAFVAMVNALLQANAAYENLGNSLTVLGVPPGMNMGDVAQKAAVAFEMQGVVDSVVSQSGGSLTQAQAIDQIFYLLNDQPNSISAYPPPNPLGSPSTALQNIFNAAGMTGL
jgi:hypothetical protein